MNIDDQLVEITFSIGTRAFEYTGLFKLLHDLNLKKWCTDHNKRLCCSPLHSSDIPESQWRGYFPPGEINHVTYRAIPRDIHLIWKDTTKFPILRKASLWFLALQRKGRGFKIY